MTSNNDAIEGPWEELIRHSDQFAGRRVRVTILSEKSGNGELMLAEFRRWLSEGNTQPAMQQSSRGRRSTFDDALVEKYRKQGLAI